MRTIRTFTYDRGPIRSFSSVLRDLRKSRRKSRLFRADACVRRERLSMSTRVRALFEIKRQSTRKQEAVMYAKILVPVDGSQASTAGLREAIKIAKSQG